MPIVSTDDTARRLRYIWLGPKGFRLPDARFPAWGLAIGLTLLGGLVSYLITPNLRLAFLGVVVSALVSVLITRRVMKHVTHDQSLAYWWAVLFTETDTPRPQRREPVRTITIPADLFDRENH